MSRDDRWRRLGVGPRREVRGRGGRRQAECNKTDRIQQNPFHCAISSLAFFASVGPQKRFNLDGTVQFDPILRHEYTSFGPRIVAEGQHSRRKATLAEEVELHKLMELNVFSALPFSELAARAASLRRNLTDRSCGKLRKSGTKLEHRPAQCYMWISADRSRRAGGGQGIGFLEGGPRPAGLLPPTARSAGRKSHFKCGEWRWQEA